jgi:hypothetical protein
MMHGVAWSEGREEQVPDIGEIEAEKKQKDRPVEFGIPLLQLQQQAEGDGKDVLG